MIQHTLRALLAAALLATGVAAANSPVQAADDPMSAITTAMQAGRLDEARNLLENVLTETPGNVEALLKLGGLELGSGHYDRSIDLMKKAASLDAESPRPFIGLAIAYVHQGRGSLAYSAIEEAVRRDPGKKAALQPLIDRLAERADDSPH